MSTEFLPIELPSKCIPYKSMGIKPEDIQARPYNGGDEITLAQINPLNLERHFLAVLKNVVKGIDPKNLTVGDRTYLIIWEYVNSYSEILKQSQMCSNCLQTPEFVINLIKDIKIAHLSEEYAEPKEVELPISKEKVTLRILTVGDEVDVERMAIKDPQGARLYRYAKSITSCDEPFVHMERMKTWPAKDVARIRKFHDIDTYHGPKDRALVECPNCGQEEEVIIPFRFDFFYPTGETLRSCFGA